MRETTHITAMLHFKDLFLTTAQAPVSEWPVNEVIPCFGNYEIRFAVEETPSGSVCLWGRLYFRQGKEKELIANLHLQATAVDYTGDW